MSRPRGGGGKTQARQAEGRLLACSPFWPPWRLSKTDLPSRDRAALRRQERPFIKNSDEPEGEMSGTWKVPTTADKEGTMDERWGLVVIVARGRACLTPKRDANKEIHADVF